MRLAKPYDERAAARTQGQKANDRSSDAYRRCRVHSGCVNADGNMRTNSIDFVRGETSKIQPAANSHSIRSFLLNSANTTSGQDIVMYRLLCNTRKYLWIERSVSPSDPLESSNAMQRNVKAWLGDSGSPTTICRTEYSSTRFGTLKV